MKNLLSITALLAASFCFAGSIAKERTEISYLKPDRANELVSDQDTTRNRRQPPANRKRDMVDTSQVRPDRRADTTDLRNMPVDSPPGSMPKHRM
ncbi:MAG: hypothetical protein JNM21_14070 [Taibaiella sp.]|nr:hypothetical protein [Taibaiella sp.]